MYILPAYGYQILNNYTKVLLSLQNEGSVVAVEALQKVHGTEFENGPIGTILCKFCYILYEPGNECLVPAIYM